MGDFQAACHPHYYGMIATPSPRYPYGHMPTPQSLVVSPSDMSDTGAVSSSFPGLSPPATNTTTTPTAASNLSDVAECFYNQPVTPHQPLPFTPGSIFSSDHLTAQSPGGGNTPYPAAATTHNHQHHHPIRVSTPVTEVTAPIVHHPQLVRQLSSSSQVTNTIPTRRPIRHESPISPTQLPNDHRRASIASTSSTAADRSDSSSTTPAFSPQSSPKPKRRDSTTKLKQRRQRQRQPSRRKSSAPSLATQQSGDLDEDDTNTNTNSSKGNSNAGKGGPDRHQRVLERNRIAANRCRLRKRGEADALESREREMEEHHRFLSDTLRSLSTEVYELKSQLLQHTDCNCSLIQTYIAHEARRSVDSIMGVTSPPGGSGGNSSSAAGSAVESLGIRTPETEVGPGGAAAFWATQTHQQQRQHRHSIAAVPPSHHHHHHHHAPLPPTTNPQQQGTPLMTTNPQHSAPFVATSTPLVAAPPPTTTTGAYHEIPPLMLDPSSFTATTPTPLPLGSAPYITTPDFISADQHHHHHQQQHIENSGLWNPYWSFN